MATKKATKKVAPVYKAGQYFKGVLEELPITGRIVKGVENYQGDKKNILVAIFKDYSNEYGKYNTPAEDLDYEGFDGDANIEAISQLEIITKRQHEALLKHTLYTGFMGYMIYMKKGKTPAQDKFEFGCGAISVTRAEIEQLLAVFKVVPPSQLAKVASLLNKIDDEAGQEISDSDIPLIKQILEA